MRKVHVALGGRSYDILLDKGLLDGLGAHVAKATDARRALVLTDENVGPRYAGRALSSLQSAGIEARALTLPAGEKTKCLDRFGEVCREMARAGLTRSDALVALGGGVVGDLGGFAASAYLRGICLVQAPTTLLSQVDSAVGGKTAIDLPEGKNLVGSFYQPSLVLIDQDTLDTLPERVFCDGMGEVIKYAAAFDESLWDPLDEARAHLEEIVPRCLEIKRGVVERDERDMGERMLLNFGHTLGHAIEAAQGYRGYTHGEAVAAGMCLMTRLSEKAGLTRAGTAARIEAMCGRWHLPVSASKALWEDMRCALSRDKKHLQGEMTIVSLASLGHGQLKKAAPDMFEEVRAWLR